MEISISAYNIHHDERNFPDPEKFNPSRFLSENRHKIKPFSYMPFSKGIRNCLGEISPHFSIFIRLQEIGVWQQLFLLLHCPCNNCNWNIVFVLNSRVVVSCMSSRESLNATVKLFLLDNKTRVYCWCDSAFSKHHESQVAPVINATLSSARCLSHISVLTFPRPSFKFSRTHQNLIYNAAILRFDGDNWGKLRIVSCVISWSGSRRSLMNCSVNTFKQCCISHRRKPYV